MTLAMSRCEAVAGTRCRAWRVAANEAGAVAKVTCGRLAAGLGSVTRKPMKSLEYLSDRLLGSRPLYHSQRRTYMMEPMEQQELSPHFVSERLRAVRDRIADACQLAKRSPDEVTLIAVGKAQPEERLVAALDAGQRIFGENYVQEAKNRWPALRVRYDDVTVHMIGALQSNKASDAVALFDVIQTLDRPKLAHALAKEIARQQRNPRLFVQVNTGNEPQKAGVSTHGLIGFLALCRDELKLNVEGLMAIPPVSEDVALHAALLAKLAKENGLPSVSIGMSADFDVAIRFGATHVRVGTEIFGKRPPKNAN